MQASRRRGVTRSVVTSLGLALLLAVGGAGAGAALAADPDPVLLVHGYRGDPSTWADMIARFAAEGRTAVAIDLPVGGQRRERGEDPRLHRRQGLGSRGPRRARAWAASRHATS